MIIGIIGKARSGKDTFAGMFAKEINRDAFPPYVMMAFAQELKNRCQKDFDLSYEQLWGDDKEALDKRYPKIKNHPAASYWTAREIMQEYGQFYRTIDYDFWVKNLFRVIEDKEYPNVIITDVRHINEADSVLEHGGVLIKVIRNNAPQIHGEQHISETALDDYRKIDFTVVNNFGLKELEESAIEVVSFIKEGVLKNKFTKEIKING
jgi:hypothetical protein